MKTLNDLKLKAKEKAIVRTWLMQIVKHYERMSDGERETVERYDIDNLDFFYFTDCHDILSKNPESKGVEDAKSIRQRKKAVEYKLIFQSLLGKKLGRKRPCSHCGNDDRFINSLGDGTGHYVYCPKCKMTVVVTYPIGYPTCIERVKEDLYKHGYDPMNDKALQYREYLQNGGTLIYKAWLEITNFEEQIANDEEIEEEFGEEKKHKCCGRCKNKIVAKEDRDKVEVLSTNPLRIKVKK